MDTLVGRQAPEDELGSGDEMWFDYEEPPPPAPAEPPIDVLRLLGTKWSVRILLHLAHGPSRYSGVHRAIPGLSQKVLTQLLGKLQDNGLIKRNVWPTQPIHVEYALTTTGAELVGFLHELRAWAEAAGLAAEGR